MTDLYKEVVTLKFVDHLNFLSDLTVFCKSHVKGQLHSKPKLSMFRVLFHKYQHCFDT